ncbi:MAG: SDR family oxidoreductase [Betaproteobacteria bacterium]|nr:SDR family oxidoreductase [Betaproteobacteria bacterium]
MDFKNRRILLTGAGGGIGRILSEQLAAEGARLCRLVHCSRVSGAAGQLASEGGGEILTLACDVTQSAEREDAVLAAEETWGGVDMLINLAGVLDFKPFQAMEPGMLHRMLAVNIEAPMQFARLLLPGMLARGHGHLVNVGSMFGSIGFPFFSAYSASKFALRGFSQALRRELAGTGVRVTYVAPRAVKTPLNPPIVHEMAAQGLMTMDDPEPVARAILRAIARERGEAYLGFPESVFARLNAIFPALVDKALAKQTPTLARYATSRASR